MKTHSLIFLTILFLLMAACGNNPAEEAEEVRSQALNEEFWQTYDEFMAVQTVNAAQIEHQYPQVMEGLNNQITTLNELDIQTEDAKEIRNSFVQGFEAMRRAYEPLEGEYEAMYNDNLSTELEENYSAKIEKSNEQMSNALASLMEYYDFEKAEEEEIMQKLEPWMTEP
ncbi:hypothetical protein [Salibacterium qingdaonense]|uniref:Cell-wall binding lipoprotein n=1 Tax=Salibacterium qingdaonense TaxID=266892 RepID=A0A1I4I5X0_9BACI|nr:hypothetical protein [Salibacterium qingdaonense]SFL49171.1 hypothetical protein SAMN04488054_101211 [Salibacterium qingdaonense]